MTSGMGLGDVVIGLTFGLVLLVAVVLPDLLGSVLGTGKIVR
jgi:hypothetical protein